MQQFALGWLVVDLAVRDGSPQLAGFYLGLRSLASALPALAFGLFAGVLADRVDRRDLLLRARLAAGFVAIVLAALVIADRVNIAIVMALSGAASAAFAFDPPGRLAIVASVVPVRDLISATGLTRASQQVAHALGPLLGGILIVPLGVGGVLLAKAGLTVASVATLVPMNPRPPPRANAGVLRALREGLGHVGRDDLIRSVVVLQVVFALLTQAVISLLPALAVQTLGVGAVELSWLTAAMGAGSIVGAFAIAITGSVERRGTLLLVTLLICGALGVALGLQRTVVGAVIVLLGLGLMQQLFMGVHTVILQLATPDHLRGRVMGTQSVAFMSFGPIGVLAVGTLGTFIGISNALMVAGGLVVLATGVASLRYAVVRDLRGGTALAGFRGATVDPSGPT